MADLNRLIEALQAADAANDVEGAKVIAQAIRAAQQGNVQQPKPPENAPIREGVPFMTPDGPLVLRDGKLTIMSQEQFDVSTGKTKTAGQLGREALPIEDLAHRGSILPIGQTKAGDYTFAVPEMLLAAPQGATTLMSAMKGAPITVNELTESTLAAVAPFAGGITGVSRLAKPQKLSKKLIKGAPSTKKLLKKGGAQIDEYVKTGDIVSGDDFSSFWVRADDMLKKAGFDEETTPAIAKQMRSLARRAEKESIDPQEMVNIRRGIKDLMKSINVEPTDKRLAAKLLDEFDDFVATIPGGAGWKAGRGVYAQGKKSQMIEEALAAAQNTASGIENGLRIEFRKILNSQKKSLGFTGEEKQAMQDIVRGNFTRNSLKKISSLSFGSDAQRNPFAMLGSILGAGVGGGVAGAPGAILGASALPVIGAAAQKTLEGSTVNAAKALRALTAGARAPARTVFKDPLLFPRILDTSAIVSSSKPGGMAGSLLEQGPQQQNSMVNEMMMQALQDQQPAPKKYPPLGITVRKPANMNQALGGR